MSAAKLIRWGDVLLAAQAKGLSPAEVARQEGVTISSVLKACEKTGLPLAPARRGRRPRWNWPIVLKNAADGGKSIDDVAAEHGASRAIIYRMTKKLGVPLPWSRAA